MSHNVEHFTYPLKVDKKKVQKNLDNYVAHQDWQEGCTGLYRDIRWIEGKVYPSYDQAVKAIEEMDKGCYDQIAVQYYEPLTFTDDKKKQMEEEVKKLWREYEDRGYQLYPKTLKSALVGCKNCGSRLSTQHLKINQCPVCGRELRPDYILKAIAAAKKRWERAVDKLNAYVDKHAKKEIQWLVKIEYHT